MFVLLAALTLVLHLILKRTRPGLRIYAVGENLAAAQLRGVSRRRALVIASIAGGLVAGLSGTVLASYSYGASALATGLDFLISALAAAFLGSVLSKTGELDVRGTAVAAMFITALNTGLIINGVSNLVLPGIQGAILIISVLLGVDPTAGDRPSAYLLGESMSGQKMAPVGAGAGGKGTVPVTARTPFGRTTDLLRDYGVILGMLGALLVFGILEPAVLTPANLASVVDQSSSLVILAVGLAIVMMMRGVDLSVAQVSDAAGLIAAMLLVQHQPLFLVFVLPLVFGVMSVGSMACSCRTWACRRSSGPSA